MESRTLRARFGHWAATATFGILLGTSSATYAVNGNLFIVPCASCFSLAEFRTAGLNMAKSNAYPGIYIIGSDTYPRSAYVKVVGNRQVICPTPERNDCYYVLSNYSASVVTENGATASEADLEQTDAKVFALNRKAKIPRVKVPAGYKTSIIGSLDQEVGPGISQGLVSVNINPGFLQIGTVVTAVFVDGTSGQFIKQCTCSDMWSWTGVAWGSDGKPINRNTGAPLKNPSTGGSGGGRMGHAPRPGSGLLDGHWFDIGYGGNAGSTCTYSITVTSPNNAKFTQQKYVGIC